MGTAHKPDRGEPRKDEAPELAGCEGFRKDDDGTDSADVRTDVQTPPRRAAATPRHHRLLLGIPPAGDWLAYGWTADTTPEAWSAVARELAHEGMTA
jgi:hypothetical protein